MDFEALAEERRSVKEMCRKHVPSVLAFKFKDGPSFHVLRGESEPSDDIVHHLTTTATCIESLEDCHQAIWPEGGASREQALDGLRQAFYSGALNREEWVSEDSAPIYCAARALPLFLRCNAEWSERHSSLVASIYEQLKDDPKRFAVGEKTLDPEPHEPKWFPENAYHTYWALVVLDAVRSRLASTRAEGVIGSNLERVEHSMRLWAREKLADEIALHWADSAALDSDQLTWALTTFMRFEVDLSSNLRAQDLVRKAFEALGKTQQPVGVWRHYRPLFVYKNVGNAYCYVYESFTCLLKALLKKFEQEEFLEDLVRGFIGRLRDLRKYAETTQVRDNASGTTAWCSGHRPANPDPEGWATASVFSFLQAYRRLLGILARRDALRALPRPVFPKHPDPLQKIADRGDAWLPPTRRRSVAADLITMFVNPVLMASPADRSEPDDQLIKETQARSAILFGPPGTGKTKLTQYVAAALGWDYIELRSSHFVAEGIQAVQSTADRIFARLRELDRAVVLFDEPDELVREREGASDAFGRFLTTSMLPKVADLWKQGRIIYFVATNHIRYFDAAIIRSERFDVLVFVPPPSFSKKKAALRDRLIGLHVKDPVITVTQVEIEERLKDLDGFRWGGPRPEAELPDEAQLAKFVLLRWDQIDELACALASRAPSGGALEVDARRLSTALRDIRDQRLSRLQTYLDYFDDFKYARTDFQRKAVFRVRRFEGDETSLPKAVTRTDSGLWFSYPPGECPLALDGYKVVETSAPGEVDIAPL
ncbi:MAG: ATP-binding protein [Bryobacteraceae bacterium]